MKVEGREMGTFHGSLRGGAEDALSGDVDQGIPFPTQYSLSGKAFLGIDPGQICGRGAPWSNQMQEGGDSQEAGMK
jgi:hypothetical protein